MRQICVVTNVVGFRVVVDDEFDVVPGSMSSFGFIENPGRVVYFSGAYVVLLPLAASFLSGDFVTFGSE